MPVKLRVINEAVDETAASEYLFEAERITIGRGSDNHLTLDDPERIVSTQHAELRRQGDTYQLVDRGSKNFTYFRDQRLQAGTPHDLRDGDAFYVGNFRIEFAHLRQEAPASQAEETVFAADFSNPFADPVHALADVLEDIVEAYEREAPQRREDALADAFREIDDTLRTHDAVHRVLGELGIRPSGAAMPDSEASQPPASSAGKGAASPPRTPRPSPGDRGAFGDATPSEPEPSEPARRPEPAGGGREARRRDASSAPAVQASDDAVDAVLDTLLESFSRIAGIPWQFRHEFIGQTIMQSAETQFLFDGDAASMKRHLLNPGLSAEERAARLQHIEDAAEALVVHQVAMLNGYKASVMDGAEELMETLNPDAHQTEVVSDSVLYQYVPVLASPAVLDRLRAQWAEHQRGDWSAAEQRIFRPAFIKAYLARMTAIRA